MSDAAPDDVPQIRPRTALESARRYWENLRVLGEEGATPVPVESHGDMCRTAALMSIAESLDRLADPASARSTARRFAHATAALETVAKELTKIRYIMK